MENTKDFIIEVSDNCRPCFTESTSFKKSEKRGPEGYVDIYEIDKDGTKKLVGKENLVVYAGREWLLSRAFNTQNENITPTSTEFISWLGLGNGGAPDIDPFNPSPPTNLDTGLVSEIPINSSDITCADFRDGMYYKHPFDSLTFLQDPDNNNKYLILEVLTTIGSDDANDYVINEAALFTNISMVGGAVAPFSLYSKITFPSRPKSSSSQLIFAWYIYY